MDPQQSDWAVMKPHVLSLILQAQHNALDNCAAARVCINWRDAVQSTPISMLHLHARHGHHHKHWSKFLQSRLSFRCLKLTSSVRQTTVEDTEDLKARGKSCFLHLPRECDTLFVGQYFTDALHQYIHKTAAAGLRHLTVQATDLDGHATDVVFPSHKHLTQLRSLHIVTDAKTLSVRSTALDNCLRSCSTSLESLVIEAVKMPEIDVPVLFQLEQCLQHITKLELRSCCTILSEAFPGGVGITALSGLQHLSLHGSTIQGDQTHISTLTRLTHLDVALCNWFSLGQLLQHNASALAGPLGTFHGWPALQVLRVNRCNLYGEHTLLHVKAAQELHVSYVGPHISMKELHIDTDSLLGNPEGWLHYLSLPICVHHLVELKLRTYSVRHASSLVPAGLCSLLEHCRHLKALHLTNFAVSGPFQALSVDVGQGACLQELCLHGFSLAVVDLSSLVSLTKVKLDRLRHRPSTVPVLHLPCSLLSFSGFGSYLFSASSRQPLFETSHLTHLELSLDLLDAQHDAALPYFPGSLLQLHLRLADNAHGCDLGKYDWSCLEACTNLESLTLPCASVGLKIQAWIDSARHLHTIIYE